MNLNDGKVRRIRAEDLPRVLEWRNSERIAKNMFSDHIIKAPEHKKWFETLDWENNYCLVFELKNKPAGIVNINGIDRHNGICSWGFYLGETELPKGAGLLMGYLALEFIFNELNIRKLCSQAFAYNTVSIRYHKRLGFEEEGYLIKQVKKNGCYEDIVDLALFGDKWNQQKDVMISYIESINS